MHDIYLKAQARSFSNGRGLASQGGNESLNPITFFVA